MDRNKLKALAQAATQDGWELKDFGSQIGLRVASGYQAFFNTQRPNREVEVEVRANAAFFGAAQPAAVLELIALVEHQAAELEISQRERTEALAATRAPAAAEQDGTGETVAEVGSCPKNDGYSHIWRGRTVESQSCRYCGLGWEPMRRRLDAAMRRAPTADQIVDVILKLVGEGIMDWTQVGPDYEGADDGGFNDAAEERAAMLDAVRKAMPIPVQPADPTILMDVGLPELREHLRAAAISRKPVTLSYISAASLFHAMSTGEPLTTAPVQAAPSIPPMWISELCGEGVDDLSYGQGYRRGFNDCRAKVLAAAPTADPGAWLAATQAVMPDGSQRDLGGAPATAGSAP